MFVDGEALRRNGVTLTLDEKAAAEAIEVAATDYYSEI